MVGKLEKIIEEIHEKSCSGKRDFYIDPNTGFLVFTSYFLKERGYCCESSCRHCPYGYVKKE